MGTRKQGLVRRLASLTAVAVAGAAVALLAAPAIDQEQVNVDPDSNLLVGGSPGQMLAQVFTAGRTGRLTHVTLPIGCTPTSAVTVWVERVSGGLPNGQVLTRTRLPGTDFPMIEPSPGIGFRIIEFQVRPKVTAGRQYAIVVDAGIDGCGVYSGPTASSSYPGGVGYYAVRSDLPEWAPFPLGSDLAFQTFVDPAGR